MDNIEKHFPLVWSIARSFSRETSEDSDAYAEGLLWLVEALRTYDETKGTKPQTWIYGIVKNGILQWKRKRSNARMFSDEDSDNILESVESAVDPFPSDDVADLVQAVLSIDDPRLRDISVCRMAGHSWDAIGREVGCSASTAADHFNRRVMPQLRSAFGVS